jgi:hypothetical protein
MSASKPSPEGDGDSARQGEVFRDLRRRNERRARLSRTRPAEAQREPPSEWERVGQFQRQRRFRRIG